MCMCMFVCVCQFVIASCCERVIVSARLFCLWNGSIYVLLSVSLRVLESNRCISRVNRQTTLQTRQR